MAFVATVNVPGYLPEGDPTEFETAAEAWEYLTGRRREDEEVAGDSTDHRPDCPWGNAADYSEAVAWLAELAERGERAGPDTVITPTPGRCNCPDGEGQSATDLGLAYCVTVAEPVDHPNGG